MIDYHCYRFYVDGILTAVVFCENDFLGVSDYHHKAYPNSCISFRIV